ncbi:MAG: histone deacetylase family protein [Pseudomonadota bacterium]|nr:histone deacetylase family protein [Pseudomonadota bacterium]
MRAIFDAAFAGKSYPFEQIEEMAANPAELDFEPILLIAEDQRGTVLGLSFTFFFPELRLAYLQYIASDPSRPRRGIGGALYEALRELLVQKGARGLLLDIPPTDAVKAGDAKQAAANRRRLRFYESFGARMVMETEWDVTPNPRNANMLTSLVFDPLGRAPRLPRSDARAFARRVLVAQYHYAPGDPFVQRIVRSFKSDPVALHMPASRTPSAPPTASRRLMPLKLIVSERHELHHLREKGYEERPARVGAILRGLETLPLSRLRTRRFPESHIAEVHNGSLIAFLKRASRELAPGTILYAEVFPPRHRDRLPVALAEQAGYFAADTFSPVTAKTWTAAKDAVDCALTGAREILSGEQMAYALCRPPGHHAERDLYCGYCFLNNSAIAANELSKHGRVALLDVDFHHGNGAQDIFYERADVLTLSLHGDPRHAYPNFAGFADETGKGAGEDFNANFPLPPGTEDAQFLKTLDKALARISEYRAETLVVSLGFDFMRGDPSGNFLVGPGAVRQIGERIGGLRLPTLVVQEGGYSLRNLRVGAHAFFSGLTRNWY